MTKAEKDVERWESTLVSLDGQRKQTAEHIEELQKRKRGIALAAHTGDAAARKRLDTMNDQVRRSELALHDLALAVEEANRELSAAHERVRQDEKAAKLKALRALAEKRFEVAARIDRALAELAADLDAHRALSLEMGGNFDFGSENDLRRLNDPSARIQRAVGSTIGAFIDMPQYLNDPRRGRSLCDDERAALAPLTDGDAEQAA